MEYKDMLERAERMRSRELFGQIDESEFEKFSVIQEELNLNLSCGKVKVFQIKPEKMQKNAPMIINFHGGGFIKGRQSKDKYFCMQVAEKFNCLVWDIDYSLAPESPFPKAVNESYAVVERAFNSAKELKINADKICLIGHSAGGNLATTVCLKLGETKLFQPCGLMIEFCPLDLYTDPNLKPRAEGDMPAEIAKTYNSFYSEPEIAINPYVSPIFASEEMLSKFPKTLIISAKLDSLCFEDEEFAMKLARSGVETICKRFQNSHHGFTINRMDDFEEATLLIYKFIKERFCD